MYGEQDGYFYVAMQYVEGRNLAEVLRAERRIDPVRAATIALELCEQLGKFHSAHAAVVHGDVKPSNIHLGQHDTVRLLDFGIAKTLRADCDATEHNFGSPGYCSPERLARSEVDHQSDLWAVGATLYEMLAGAPPYQAENTRKLEAVIRSKRPPRALPAGVPARPADDRRQVAGGEPGASVRVGARFRSRFAGLPRAPPDGRRAGAPGQRDRSKRSCGRPRRRSRRRGSVAAGERGRVVFGRNDAVDRRQLRLAGAAGAADCRAAEAAGGAAQLVAALSGRRRTGAAHRAGRLAEARRFCCNARSSWETPTRIPWRSWLSPTRHGRAAAAGSNRAGRYRRRIRSSKARRARGRGRQAGKSAPRRKRRWR